MKRPLLLRIAATAALCLGSLAFAGAEPKVGSVAPAFSGTTVAGKKISLAQYKGKVVLLNFFSKY